MTQPCSEIDLSVPQQKEEWTVKVFRKIEEIPARDWNQVFPRVLEGYDFFRALDQSGFKEFTFYYILVYQDQALAAATTCFLMSYPLDTTVRGLFKTMAALIKKFLPEILNLKALICGMPLGPGQIGMVGNPEKVLAAILGCMEEIARKEKVPILAFKDFGLSYTGELDPLQSQGFYKFLSLPNTEMNIHFKDFEDYLGTLSKATRYDLRRKFKKVDGQIKIDLEIRTELNRSIEEEVFGLFQQTASRGEIQFEKTPREFFGVISRTMGVQVRYFLWRIDQKLVAFTLCLVSHDRLIDYYLGLDYPLAHQYHLYFVRFRDLLSWCIEHKIKKYEMGSTCYEPKKRLDFKLIPLYVYAKHRNPYWNPFFKLLCRLLKPENFDETLP